MLRSVRRRRPRAFGDPQFRPKFFVGENVSGFTNSGKEVAAPTAFNFVIWAVPISRRPVVFRRPDAWSIHFVPKDKSTDKVFFVVMDSGLCHGHPSFDWSKNPDKLNYQGVVSIGGSQLADDDNGHGCSAASVVVSIANIRGVANWVTFGNFKVLDHKGRGDTKTIVAAYAELTTRLEAMPNGTRIVNLMSFGSTEWIEPINQAIATFIKAGGWWWALRETTGSMPMFLSKRPQQPRA